MAETEDTIAAAIPGAAPSTDLTSEAGLAEAKLAFDNLLAQQKAGDELDPKKAEKAAKDGLRKKAEKPVKQAKSVQKAAEEPKGEEAAAEPAAKPKESKPAKSGEMDRLRAKLLLSGAPKAAVETLSDDDVREWNRNQEERERDRQAAFDRAAAAEKKLAETTSKTPEPTKGVPTEELDLEDIASQLATQFGEDEGGLFMKALQAVTAPLLTRIGEMETVLNDARKRGVETISKTNRERLSEKLPFLAESDEAWKVLHDLVEADFKSNPSAYKSAEEGFDKRFEQLYGPLVPAHIEEVELESEAEDKADQRAQIAASAPTPPNVTKREKKLSPEQAAYAVFKHLDSGDAEDIEGARRIWNRSSQAFVQ